MSERLLVLSVVGSHLFWSLAAEACKAEMQQPTTRKLSGAGQPTKRSHAPPPPHQDTNRGLKILPAVLLPACFLYSVLLFGIRPGDGNFWAEP